MKVKSHIILSRFLPVLSHSLYSGGAFSSLLLPPLYLTFFDFHLDEAEEAWVSWESDIVLSHDSDFIFDVWEGDAEESAEHFEGFAELSKQFEELIEDDFFVFL